MLSILVKPSWSADVIYPLEKPELEKIVVAAYPLKCLG
jgi:hypothetical protein